MKTLGKVAQIILCLMIVGLLFYVSIGYMKPQRSVIEDVQQDVRAVVNDPKIIWEPDVDLVLSEETVEVVQDSKEIKKKTWREKASDWWNKEKPPKPPKKINEQKSW